MFLHCNTRGKDYASTRNASTIATERFIGQSQAKTTQLQSLCQEPSAAETLDRAGQLQYNLSVLKELSAKGMKIKSTNNRRKTAYQFSQHQNQTDYEYPSTYDEFKMQMCEAFFAGLRLAQKEMEKLPLEFKTSLGEYWKAPFVFNHGKCDVVCDKPADSYDHLDFSRRLEENDVQADKEYHDTEVPTDDRDASEEATPSPMPEPESDEEIEGVTQHQFQITRGNGTVHLSTALKLAMNSRDRVHKERSKRHIVYPLTEVGAISPLHDIIILRYYITKNNPVSIVQIVAIQAENGAILQSTTKCGKDQFRGIKMDYDDKTHTITKPTNTLVSPWMPVRNIQGEVKITSNENGSSTIDAETAEKMQELCNKRDDLLADNQEEGDIPEGFYQIEDIVDRRLDKSTHTQEYLVNFKDYGIEEMQWLPEGAFLNTVPFTTKSKYGRTRKHATSRFTGK